MFIPGRCTNKCFCIKRSAKTFTLIFFNNNKCSIVFNYVLVRQHMNIKYFIFISRQTMASR